MKKRLLLLNLLFVSSFVIAQDNFLIGKWKYERIPEHIKIDEQGLKMTNDFFKDMTLAFDKNNYSQFVMGKSENGTWSLISDDVYEFNSSKGYKYQVEIKKISKNQIIFKQQNREWQLIKSDEKTNIETIENSIDKIEGIFIDKVKLIGKWFYNGQIKAGKENNLILKHNDTEIVNYTFLENGNFINKSPFEIELIANWEIGNDNKTLVIVSEELAEFLKIMKLNDTELYLYNPKNDSILKFKR
jgi:hypothetical protein